MLAEIPDAELARGPSETDDIAYVNRVALAVHNSTYNCEPGDFSLTPIESVLSAALSAFGLINSEIVWQEGLLQKETLICGFCSQRAIVTSDILRENGIEAWAFGVNGHVLVKFAVDGHEYLADPDYGVPAYRYDVSRKVMHREIASIYTKAGWTNADQIYDLVSSRSDNDDYSSPENISRIKARQEVVFLGADIIAFGLFLLAGYVALGLIRSRAG